MPAGILPKTVFMLAACLLAGCAGSNTVGFGSIGGSGFGVASETPLDTPANADPQCADADADAADGSCEAQPQPMGERLPATGTDPE